MLPQLARMGLPVPAAVALLALATALHAHRCCFAFETRHWQSRAAKLRMSIRGAGDHPQALRSIGPQPARYRDSGAIIPWANGTNAPVISITKAGQPRRLYNYGSCARRTFEPQTTALSPYSKAAVGLVVVVCREDLGWLQELPGGCRRKHVYIYSKCGESEPQLRSRLGRVSGCMTVEEIKPSVMSEITHVKMHADYLRHIVSRYNALEPHLVFLKARVGDEARQRKMAAGSYTIAGVIRAALTGNWAFLGIWPYRIHVDFRYPEARGRETCLFYKRYTCEAECYTCTDSLAHPLCYAPRAKSMFIVSRARIRSLPSSEYLALHQWLVSHKDTFPGWFGHRRRYVMERLWPALFGCDHDVHRTSRGSRRAPGCKENMAFGGRAADHAGQSTEPPAEAIRQGQVTWPQPRFLGNVTYFPHIFTWEPPVTIVAALPTNGAMDAAYAMLKSALLANPDARLKVLANKDLEVHRWDPEFWGGRLTVTRLRVGEAPSGGAGDGDWATLSMQASYLRRLASSAPVVKRETGHLVLVRPNVIFYRTLKHVFDSSFSLGVSLQPVAGSHVDLSAWFVHKDGVDAAADVLARVLESYRNSMASTMMRVLGSCFEEARKILDSGMFATAGKALAQEEASPDTGFPVTGRRRSGRQAALDADEDTADVEPWPRRIGDCAVAESQSGGREERGVSVLLVPCEIFNAHRDHCPPDHKARVVSLIRVQDRANMPRMWAALQSRTRESLLKFFSFVKRPTRAPAGHAEAAESGYAKEALQRETSSRIA